MVGYIPGRESSLESLVVDSQHLSRCAREVPSLGGRRPRLSRGLSGGCNQLVDSLGLRVGVWKTGYGRYQLTRQSPVEKGNVVDN